MPDIEHYAELGDEDQITDDDGQRLKWFGLFLRKQTPGHMMMRLRATCGKMNAAQWRVVADLSDEFGKGFCDLTTRQQIQLRWFTIGQVPQIWQRLMAVGLTTLQTGMDNVRGVCGCPASGLTPNELFDASPVAEAYTDLFLGDPALHEPAAQVQRDDHRLPGELLPPGDAGSGPHSRDRGNRTANRRPASTSSSAANKARAALRPATPLDVFVTPERSGRDLRTHHAHLQRPRLARGPQPRPAGVPDRRPRHRLVPRRAGAPRRPRTLARRRRSAAKGHTDHVGIYRQKQPGLNYAGLLVPVGRITTKQMRGVADLAERYGNGEIRVTTGQNVILPGIPDGKLGDFEKEPLLKELPVNPSPVMRGLVSCTGNDYCHLALIETKGWAIDVARRTRNGPGRAGQERRAAHDSLVGLFGRLRFAPGGHDRLCKPVAAARPTGKSSMRRTSSSAAAADPAPRPGRSC